MKQRVLTALALIPVVLGVALCASPIPLIVVLLAVTTLGSLEAATITNSDRVAVCAGGLVLLAVGVFASLHESRIVGFGALGLLGLGCLAAAYSNERLLWPFIGAWIGGPAAALLALRAAPAYQGWFEWRAPILLALLPLWGGDTAAIFVGKAFGKHPMAPAISPKKTWEGGIANLLACVIVSVPLAYWLGYSWAVGVGCGVATGVLGQAGDLFESALKRRSDRKDSGSLLPGHGGILDRIDSLLFAAPAVAILLLR